MRGRCHAISQLVNHPTPRTPADIHGRSSRTVHPFPMGRSPRIQNRQDDDRAPAFGPGRRRQRGRRGTFNSLVC
jgi:hypothetical protein